MASEGQGCGGGELNHYMNAIFTIKPSRYNMKTITASEMSVKATSGVLELAYVIQGRRVASAVLGITAVYKVLYMSPTLIPSDLPKLLLYIWSPQ